MDITTVFGTVIVGSNPAGCANKVTKKIPKEISEIQNRLENQGFEAFLVGGCVRDLILGRKPKDWDITTNATPDEIQDIFPDSFYENQFGTVGVKNDRTLDETLRVVEVTPYRIEAGYSDHRRPDEVIFSDKIGDDLQRRDFTINAIAVDSKGQIIDLYKGQTDIKEGVIRCVGNPDHRFNEDALRILRAIRLATELNFAVSHETQEAILKNANLLSHISKERIRDEFIKIIMSDEPMKGLVLCEKLGVLDYISPVFSKSIGVSQEKQAHKYTVWEHILRTLQHSADLKLSLDLRLASLFHDISKPETKRSSKKKGTTFYGHEVVGARVTHETLKNLKFPIKVIEKVEKLVRWHMFFADPEKITLSAVRRLVANIGPENVEDIINLRICDRIGTGRPKAEPYRLRKYKSMIDEALREPVSVKMLKIDGSKIMKVTHETPGPKIGYILHALFEEVIEDGSKNNQEYLENRSIELSKLPENELRQLGEEGREKKEEEEEKEIREIRKKHGVK